MQCVDPHKLFPGTDPGGWNKKRGVPGVVFGRSDDVIPMSRTKMATMSVLRCAGGICYFSCSFRRILIKHLKYLV